jgi:hypothetical protein
MAPHVGNIAPEWFGTNFCVYFFLYFFKENAVQKISIYCRDIKSLPQRNFEKKLANMICMLLFEAKITAFFLEKKTKRTKNYSSWNKQIGHKLCSKFDDTKTTWMLLVLLVRKSVLLVLLMRKSVGCDLTWVRSIGTCFKLRVRILGLVLSFLWGTCFNDVWISF